MAKKRRGLLEILFRRPVEKADVVPRLDGDTFVDLIGLTLMESITHLRYNSPESYNMQHFQYYNEFRNCLRDERFAQYISGDVRERLGLCFDARAYLQIIKEVTHEDLEEGIKRAVVKYGEQINNFWAYYQEQHRKMREIQQSTDTQEPAMQEPAGTVQNQKK
ncbi:hypothetical protein HY772_00670 [Candidatus Woesearchaeota archaeon]|nr:hypothetical protein [Candidatus Woesearchaeota archaeon]